MKILIVSQYFWPENFKGNDIAFDLVKKGHDVTVLTAKPNYPNGKFYDGYSFFNKRKEFINGVQVIRTPIFPRRNGKGIFLVLNYLSFIIFSFFAVHFRLEKGFDAVFVQQLSPVTMALPGIWAKKKNNCPLYLWILDLWPESVIAASNFSNNTILNLLDRLVNYIYNNSDKILISSKSFKSAIKPRLKNQNIEILYFPNWAEDIFTLKSKNNFEMPDLPTGFNIMFAGNVGEAQDFESVLKVAKLTKAMSINWIIIGEGRKLSWIKEKIIEDSLDRVFIYGRYPLIAMPAIFKNADAMLVSLKDEPIFSLTVPAKIQAYMASSKVILGMLNGEGNELINSSGCGFAVNAGDYNALYGVVSDLISLNPSKIKEMELCAKKYYLLHFEKNRLLDKLEKELMSIKSSNLFSN